jgi:hypothetical protein
MAKNLRIFKNTSCPDLDKQTLALLVKFLKYAIGELNLQDVEVKIRLLGKSPNEAITTGCYSPQNKTISTICDGRNLIDYCRTIAHELTHMKQDVDNRIRGNEQEIGGEIENEANMVAGIVMKKFIKNILTKEDKQHLGLGFYGS